jgi:hypothetical protein
MFQVKLHLLLCHKNAQMGNTGLSHSTDVQQEAGNDPDVGPPFPGSAIPEVRHSRGPPFPRSAIPGVRHSRGPPFPGLAQERIAVKK